VAGFYYWRVAAVDSEGDRGPFSEFMTFDIKAAQNQAGDETSYDTYLRFDEYTGHNHKFRLLVGPEYSTYTFKPDNNSVSPPAFRYHAFTARQGRIEYEYRLDNHYSLAVALSSEATRLTSSNFENRTSQHSLNLNETLLAVGATRRVFEPHYYLTFTPSIRASFIDVPVRNSNTQLTLTTFSWVGADFMAGIHKPLGHNQELAASLGPKLLYANQSIWYGATINEQFSQAVNDIFSFGARLAQRFDLVNFGGDNIGGHAYRLKLDAYVFVEFNF
jgi:hypothetical protein